LYSHYLLTWDRYILHSLTQLTVVRPQTQVSLQPLEFQYVVFFILPQFRNTYRTQDVFTWSTCRAGYQSLLNVSRTLEPHDGDSRYDHLLREFFNDPSRSGPFYLDGNKYASFAITFTKFLIDRYVYDSESAKSIYLSLSYAPINAVDISIWKASPFYCRGHPIRKTSQLS